jgi:glutamine amidotransferase
MIGIVDYGMGNLGSVRHRLDTMGVPSVISYDLSQLANADKLILPGVGHFQTGVKQLKERGLWNFLHEQVLDKKKSILGICLGMQLMAQRSEEGSSEGLGWFNADVIKFRIKDTLRYKVPHIGWNTVTLTKQSKLFENVDRNADYYFVHSFHLQCNDPADILNETFYEYSFVSAIQKENIMGVQYHPEKSHKGGEQLIKNFVQG